MSVALARLYAKYGLRFLNHLSPTSYTIYRYHGIFQALSLQILMRFTHFDIGFYIILAFLSGVYMVQTADENGDNGTVCKVAVVN